MTLFGLHVFDSQITAVLAQQAAPLQREQNA